MSSLRIPQKILTIQRGKELEVHVSDDLCKAASFMNQAYRQALRAVAGVVQRTNEYHRLARYPGFSEDDALSSFGSNVIAFSAQRGCGKTSTMLSFSRVLAKMDADTLMDENHRFLSEKDRTDLSGAFFHVLSPVSPSVLEEQQNILYVTLARLYDYARELIQREDSRRRSQYSGRGNSLEQLNGLKHALQTCYDGIIGVKQKTKEMPRDILELQDICDGLSLCKRFAALIGKIIECLGGDQHYLILQLDDADSQVKNGFCVLEDVRKYLQIPNLIILISADMELIHDSVRQNFEEYFPGRRDDSEFQNRLIRMCRKYIDKLIPPTHLISLSQLDAKVDQYASSLLLDYRTADNSAPVLPWADGKSIQDTLLMLIYRKTGVIFAKPTGYPHNIIPTTLRGLNQLLRMLVDMNDIPFPAADCFGDEEAVAQAINQQVQVQEYNLSQFADYFSNDWIHVKVLHRQDHDFLCSLRDANGEQYVPMTVDYLCEKYGVPGKRVYNSLSLDSLMYDHLEKKNKQDDYYLLFAIRTLFTLKHHKMILARKHEGLACYAAKKSAVFAVDYQPEALHLSRSYLVNPRLLSVSLGTSESVAAAIEERKDSVLAYEERRENLRRAEEDCRSAEDEKNKISQYAMNASNDCDAATNAVRNAKTELDVAQAELKSISDDGFTPNTAQERMLLMNAKKAVARAQVVLEAEQTNQRNCMVKYQILQNSKDAAEDRYAKCRKILARCREEVNTLNSKAENYEYALRIFGSNEDDPDFSSTQVRPAFVVRNALHRAWVDGDARDRTELRSNQLSAKKLLRHCMVSEDKNGNPSVSFMSFVTFLLRLGAEELQLPEQREMPADVRKQLYYAQECALVIAANWEVQDQLYKKIQIEPSPTVDDYDTKRDAGTLPKEESGSVDLSTLFERMDEVLQKQINGGAVYSYLQEACGLLQSGRPYWSIQSGYSLLSGDTKQFFGAVEYEYAFREIFDLPIMEKTPSDRSREPEENQIHPGGVSRPEDIEDNP